MKTAMGREIGSLSFWSASIGEVEKKESPKKCPFFRSLTHTLLDFMENMDNFEARTERVNFGLFQLNSDFT